MATSKKTGVKKKAPKKKTAAKKPAPKRVRRKDGLVKDSSEAKVLDMIKRKNGASVDEVCTRLKMKPGTVRVTVRNLRGKNFKIRTADDGRYVYEK